MGLQQLFPVGDSRGLQGILFSIQALFAINWWFCICLHRSFLPFILQLPIDTLQHVMLVGCTPLLEIRQPLQARSKSALISLKVFELVGAEKDRPGRLCLYVCSQVETQHSSLSLFSWQCLAQDDSRLHLSLLTHRAVMHLVFIWMCKKMPFCSICRAPCMETTHNTWCMHNRK